MKNRDTITIRNKKTGEEITVPRSQYIEEKPSSGVDAVMQDLKQSWDSAPRALGEMALSIPGGINNVGRYATHNNPVSTFANLGAGGVESGAALLSSPQKLMRYIAEKFPNAEKAMERGKFQNKGVNDPTLFESLMDFENQHGLAARSPEEASVRNAGGLMFGGKALSMLPNMFARAGTLGAEQAGRGGDPLHAAILGFLGESAGRIPVRRTKELPRAMMDMMQAVQEKAKQKPELTANMGQAIGDPLSVAFQGFPSFVGKTASKGLESLAESGSKLHIPMLPEKLLGKAYELKYKSSSPEKLAQEKLFGDFTHEDLPQIRERLAAAKRLGLGYLTPAEAALSPYEAAKQGTIGRTSSGSKLLFKKGKERLSSEEKSINSLLDTIYDAKELDPQKHAAYEETMQASVPDEFVSHWITDPVVKEAIQKLKDTPAYRKRLGSSPDTSFMYWNMVKRVLGDKSTKLRGSNKLQNTEADIIDETRRDMTSQMDEIEPTYPIARGIAEREFTREDIENFFDKRKMTGNNFYNLIKSKKKFDELMHKLEAFPEAQQKLNDMLLLFEDLIPSVHSLRAATALKRTSMSEPRNKLDAERLALDEKYGREHDVAAVKLMTDPNFLNMLSEFLKNQKGKK